MYADRVRWPEPQGPWATTNGVARVGDVVAHLLLLAGYLAVLEFDER